MWIFASRSTKKKGEKECKLKTWARTLKKHLCNLRKMSEKIIKLKFLQIALLKLKKLERGKEEKREREGVTKTYEAFSEKKKNNS